MQTAKNLFYSLLILAALVLLLANQPIKNRLTCANFYNVSLVETITTEICDNGNQLINVGDVKAAAATLDSMAAAAAAPTVDNAASLIFTVEKLFNN